MIKEQLKIIELEDKIIRDIRMLFEQEEEDYCKPKREISFYINNYIECERMVIKTTTYYETNILIKLILTSRI